MNSSVFLNEFATNNHFKVISGAYLIKQFVIETTGGQPSA